MRKLILMLAATLMLAISSVCSASAGKLLDSEMEIVDKFVSATNYKAVEMYLTPEFKKDFTEESFNNFRKINDNNFGAISSKTLRSITKFDDADVLEYQTAFVKVPHAVYIFAFAIEKEKPLIRDFSIQLPKAAAPAPAPAGK